MAKHICGHCAREFDAVGDQKRDCCPGCRELGHKGHPQKCQACKADQPAASQGGRLSHHIGKAIENSRPVPGTDLHEVRVALNDPRRQTLLSTLAGLQTIAHTPYGQKAAEDLILGYLGDAEITAAFAPFARKPG